MNDAINAGAQTSEPIQFVTDLLGDTVAAPDPSARTITDPRVAAGLIAEETRSRVRAVIERFDDVPAILLSGGVDSIYLAAVAVRLGVRPYAITIVTTGDTDATGAVRAAAALGLPRDVIRLTEAEVVDLARDAMHRLGTAELWEVAAGIPCSLRDAASTGSSASAPSSQAPAPTRSSAAARRRDIHCTPRPPARNSTA
ncbi:asparagine synthase-related protein [Nocardia sp. NPDC051787]|uniref:asparagine synthase-related protein n=1 Tax=Nocardia sp. NPDC051787 TaxID=3155415 RepID=UPI00344AD2B9